MRRRDRVHERAILDAIDALDRVPFEDDVWRVTRKGKDPTIGSEAGGRWSPPGEFEVLYASLESEGAIAEIGYRLSLEPVWPSRMEHQIHCIDLKLEQTLRLADLSSLSRLGVNVEKYESFEYGATQAIASAAHFLEFDGFMVPSARHGCSNLVVFLDRIGPETRIEVRETKPVDWSEWRKSRRRS